MLISLYDVSNRPSGGFPPRARMLEYDVHRTNDNWWVLTVTIPIIYRFAAPEVWPSAEARTQFKRDLERFAGHTWSRRRVVFSDGFFTPIRVEVHVRLVENESASPSCLWHFWVLPFAVPDAPTCVSYNFDGAFPVGRRDDGTIEYGERVRDIAVAQVSLDDVSCRTGTSTWLQRGTDHEVGHMLGLQHPTCTDNRHVCYGSTRQQQAQIMGLGSWVSARDYIWAQRIMERYESSRSWLLVDDRWYDSDGVRQDRSLPTCG